MPALDPATREALEARLRFYRELGLTDFYRRPVNASQTISSPPEPQLSKVNDHDSLTQDLGAPSLAVEETSSATAPQETTPIPPRKPFQPQPPVCRRS